MKKLLLLFIGFSVFTACNTDDTPTDESERILGIWLLTEVNNPFTNDGELNECNKRSTIEFTDDNNAKTIFYDDSNGTCESSTSNSTWKNLGDSNYEIEVPGFGKQQGQVDFEGTSSFKFRPSNFPGIYILFTKQ